MRRLLLPLLVVLAACPTTRELDELLALVRSTEDDLIEAQRITRNLSVVRMQRDVLLAEEAALVPRDAASLLAAVQAAFPRAAVELRTEPDGTVISFTATDSSRSGVAGLQVLAKSAPYLVVERFSVAGPNLAASFFAPPGAPMPTAGRPKRGPLTYPAEQRLSDASAREEMKALLVRYRQDLATLDLVNGECANFAEQKLAFDARRAERTAAGRLGAVGPLVFRLLGEDAILSEGAVEVRPGVVTISGRLAANRTQAELVGALGAFGTLKSISGTETSRVELEPKP